MNIIGIDAPFCAPFTRSFTCRGKVCPASESRPMGGILLRYSLAPNAKRHTAVTGLLTNALAMFPSCYRMLRVQKYDLHHQNVKDIFYSFYFLCTKNGTKLKEKSLGPGSIVIFGGGKQTFVRHFGLNIVEITGDKDKLQ